MRKHLFFLAALVITSCRSQSASNAGPVAAPSAPSTPSSAPPREPGGTALAPGLESGQAVAVFAGGCFWCVEAAFEGLDGVIGVVSGYAGGDEAHPTYEQVSSGATGHLEAVRVVYDPSRIAYGRLLEVFLHNIDPTQSDGQFCDHGPQYRSAIFVRDAVERSAATELLARASAELGRRIDTQVRSAGPFWVAEEHHQDYYRTHPVGYSAYRSSCGRDERLRALWGERALHGTP